jgi:hypothetical protein
MPHNQDGQGTEKAELVTVVHPNERVEGRALASPWSTSAPEFPLLLAVTAN